MLLFFIDLLWCIKLQTLHKFYLLQRNIRYIFLVHINKRNCECVKTSKLPPSFENSNQVGALRMTVDSNMFSAEDLLHGYINGIFPMADPDGTIYWYSPDPRAIIPLDTYLPSKSLRPVLNKKLFNIRVNFNFENVIRGCAVARKSENGEDGSSTWISEQIIKVYTELHRIGYAHSVEAWQEDSLVGGLYGVSVNGVFFGESMFTKVSNASKVAFHYLIQILNSNHFDLLDTQFMNENVKRYGAIEVSKGDYQIKLRKALKRKVRFDPSNNHLP